MGGSGLRDGGKVTAAEQEGCAIPGVALPRLEPLRDARGRITEIFRASSPSAFSPTPASA